MKYKRKYYIIIGSKAFFDASLPDLSEDNVDTFLELVKLSDAAKQIGRKFDQFAKTLIINKFIKGLSNLIHFFLAWYNKVVIFNLEVQTYETTLF